MTKAQPTPEIPPDDADARRPYDPPLVRRVDLAIEETLSSGCKLSGACDAPPDPDSEAGS